MSQTNSSSRLASWQAMTMLAVGIAIIFFGLMALKVNARIVLAVDGAIMCLMACAFGISYDSVQKGIKDTIASMLVAMLILLSVGILIGSWMASGTIPVMVYYGMQVITPALFLQVACILCTLMSTLAGTSWGTLATVGVASTGIPSPIPTQRFSHHNGKALLYIIHHIAGNGQSTGPEQRKTGHCSGTAQPV